MGIDIQATPGDRFVVVASIVKSGDHNKALYHTRYKVKDKEMPDFEHVFDSRSEARLFARKLNKTHASRPMENWLRENV